MEAIVQHGIVHRAKRIMSGPRDSSAMKYCEWADPYRGNAVIEAWLANNLWNVEAPTCLFCVRALDMADE